MSIPRLLVALQAVLSPQADPLEVAGGLLQLAAASADEATQRLRCLPFQEAAHPGPLQRPTWCCSALWLLHRSTRRCAASRPQQRLDVTASLKPHSGPLLALMTIPILTWRPFVFEGETLPPWARSPLRLHNRSGKQASGLRTSVFWFLARRLLLEAVGAALRRRLPRLPGPLASPLRRPLSHRWPVGLPARSLKRAPWALL